MPGRRLSYGITIYGTGILVVVAFILTPEAIELLPLFILLRRRYNTRYPVEELYALESTCEP